MKRFFSLIILACCLFASVPPINAQESVVPIEDSYCRYLGSSLSVNDPTIQVEVQNVNDQFHHVEFQYTWTSPNGNTWVRRTDNPIGSQNMVESGNYICEVLVYYYSTTYSLVHVSSQLLAQIEVVDWCEYGSHSNPAPASDY